jgi:hypothetical protein
MKGRAAHVKRMGYKKYTQCFLENMKTREKIKYTMKMAG